MVTEVRQHLHANPFEPFTIVMSSGSRYPVVTPDHAGTNPRGSRVVVWFDDDGSITLSGLHIIGIEKGAASKNGAK